MPDTRSHRGPDPKDAEGFAPTEVVRLREASDDLAWLLGRGYPEAAALELVGNRYRFRARQRRALLRSSCSLQVAQARRERAARPEEVAGKLLEVDGFNLLLTLEVALGGGVVLRGRDGAYRDLAGIHGSWRRVEETMRALRLIGEEGRRLSIAGMHWWLDRPVSNSGRLRGVLAELAASESWAWSVELVMNPDRALFESESIVVTSDSMILDRCRAWFNLTGRVIERSIPNAWIVDLA